MNDANDLRTVDHLIVGGGMTGSAAAMAIADTAPNASVVVLAAEPHPPYDRPPLSKDLWQQNDPAFDDVAHDPQLWGEAELILGRRAVALDPEAHEVLDDAGTRWRYGRLLLATGADPIEAPFLDGIEVASTFRTWDDLQAVRARLANGRRATVIGGGFLGSELAAALVDAGASVTMAFPEHAVLGRILPGPLAERITLRLRRAGIEVRAGTLVDDVSLLDATRPDGPVEIRSDDGEGWTADLIVSCIGVRPNVDLAHDAGLKIDDGIVVDERFRTSAEDVFAAGDVARFPAPALGAMRVEHEEQAKLGGAHAGRAMAGDERPYDHLPLFYSDVIDLGYEAVGRCDAELDVLLAGPARDEHADPSAAGLAWYLDDDVPVGALGWNLFGRMEEARAVLREARPFDADELRRRVTVEDDD